MRAIPTIILFFLLSIKPICFKKNREFNTANGFQTKLMIDTLYLDPSISALTGTLSRQGFFGPPGYGVTPETDQKDTFFMLNLQRPILILPNPNGILYDEYKSYKVTINDTISILQIAKGRESDLMPNLGQTICLKGLLNPRSAGQEYTRFVLDIKKIYKCK